MDDEEITMTQDCVEWNDGDDHHQLTNTPASREKKKNPQQEVEDLWKLFDKNPKKSPLKNNTLYRAHSYPRRHKRQNRSTGATVQQQQQQQRKRKRPSSANNNRPLRTTEDAAALTSAGFQDLLKQLDNASSQPEKPATMTKNFQSNSNNENMPPPPMKKPSPVHPPMKKPTPLSTNGVFPPPKAPNRVTPTNNVLLPPPHKRAKPSIRTTVPSSRATPIATPTEATTKSSTIEFEDDDFDLSAADLAALDAVLATSRAAKKTLAAAAKPTIMPPPSRVSNAPVVPPPSSRVVAAPPTTKPLIAVVPPASSAVAPATLTKPAPCPPTDEFGDLDFDFVDLDEQIQAKLKGKKETIVESKPPRESFGDPFADDFDFAALDEKIAARAPKSIPKPQQGGFRVDLSTLQVPPPDMKVRNKVVPDYDPNRQLTAFSRYQVVAVKDDLRSYTKAVMVKTWTSEMTHEATRRGRKKKPAPPAEPTGEGWIFLRGEWYHTPVAPNDAIHLCSVSGRYETNLDALPIILHTNPPHGSDQGDDLILVLHPDTLVPPTIVSETVSCSRRAVLRSRLGSTGISNKSALYGTMKHSLFEQCMSHQDFSIEFAKDSTRTIVRNTAENLVALGIKEAEAETEVLRVLPQLQQFRNDFLGTDSRPLDKAAKIAGNGVKPDMKFVARSVEGCEESLVSAEFGLKGNIDVTVKAETQDVASHFATNPAGPEASLVGIELKTGHNQNPQNAHMAQLALYTLMLAVRYGRSSMHDENASKTGMLLYLNDKGMNAIRVTPMIQELKSLVGQRNVVACELKKVSAPRGIEIVYEDDNKKEKDDELCITIGPAPAAALPDVLSAAQQCNRCYSNRECMIYAAADLSTKRQPSNLEGSHGKLLSHFCGHLEQEDLQYFLDWDRLIDLEADATAKSVSSTWLTPSFELEKSTGRTLSSLVMDGRFVAPSQEQDESEYVPITFHRSEDALSQTDISALSFEPRCLVVVSVDSTSLSSTSEEQRKRKAKSGRSSMHIARGSVYSVSDTKIVVRIRPQEGRQLNREREAAMIQRRTLKFRLDRDDVQTGLGTTRQNLINLFTGDVKPFQNSKADPKLSQNQLARNRFAWLRESVVRLRQPKYDLENCGALFDPSSRVRIPGCDMNILQREFHQLNRDQQEAVRKVFSASDYSLIQGLPGTGKSSTIAFVARLLAAHGKRVLITSYTHAAVDNLMMKLIDKGVSATTKSNRNPKMIRIGRESDSHLAVHPILLADVASNFQQVIDKRTGSNKPRSTKPSADVLKVALSNARIVGITALSIPRASVLVGQNFDVVIVDEAGQISQPVILGALMAADTFVLVGDHKQLPPVVTSDIAEKAGFGVSMLSRLAEEHPTCVAQLTLQYRMHEDICQICNDIVYGGTLKCANQNVKSKLLKLDRIEKSNPDRWLSHIIDPKRPVVFADTDYFERDMSQNIPKQLVGLERRAGKSGKGNTVNDREVSIVRRLIHGLLDAGLPASSICVISPFRAQVRQFNESHAIAHWKTAGLEVSTIDRYQGRDKPVIILSFVRSNAQGYSGRLLNDFRRLNVAVSRAMQKLIMVGSYSTLTSGSTVLRPVLENLKKRRQTEKIPELILRSQIS